MLLAVGLAGHRALADTNLNDLCPGAGLAAYTDKPYASEKGVRRRCALLERLPDHGAMLAPALRERLDDELAKRFTVEIPFTGSVALDGATVDYLMEHMPETAALVSAHSDRDYQATQMDATPGPAGFFVTNGDTFAANFAYLSSRVTPDTSEHVFLESGYAKVLFWRVWGNAIVHYQLDKGVAGAAEYAITVHAFTDSRVLRAVLKSTLFRYFADDMFQDILADVVSGVEGFLEDPEPEDKLPPYFINGLAATLEEKDDAGLDPDQRFPGRPQ